jgi:hypothetical protein
MFGIYGKQKGDLIGTGKTEQELWDLVDTIGHDPKWYEVKEIEAVSRSEFRRKFAQMKSRCTCIPPVVAGEVFDVHQVGCPLSDRSSK